MFKARQYVAALEVPQFEDLDGVTHTGRLLSFDEMALHYERLSAAYGQVEQDASAVTKVMLDACQHMFNAAAVAALTKMPGVAVEAAMLDFFQAHRPAEKGPSEPSPMPTSA